MKLQLSADSHKLKNILSVFIRVHLWLIFFAFFFSSCSTPPTDMRSLAPGDAIVYLETPDLGETLQALTENPAWENSAAEKPDFSALKNIQAAVVVTGFETSEKQVTDQNSVLNFKPHFILIADTHQWKPTAVSIVENQIGQFARRVYGDDAKLERSEKRDAQFFVWSSADGRKLFAAVSKSVIYVGNDESLVDKSLAVQCGDAESLLKNENLARARENADGAKNLAFGYISPEGVAQIASLAGVSAAVSMSEEGAVRSFIAKVLPDVLQKTAKEIVWTARKKEQGIEDEINIKTDPEVSTVFKETLIPAGADTQFQAAEFLPQQFNSVTRYNLQNPQIAWRSVLLVASKQMDAASSRLLLQFSNAFFQPYEISDGESFLNAAGAEIVTARFDEDGENSVVIAETKDAEKMKKTISDEINFKSKPEKIGAAEVWQSEDKQTAAAFIENKLILGERESVLSCLQAKESGKNFAKTVQFQNLPKDSVTVTIAKDTESEQKIVEVLGKPKENKGFYTSFYTTATRFTGNGFERRTVSDFGLLGMIIEQFNGQK